MHDHHHDHKQGPRRGLRFTRFFTALAVFAATTAGLHALSDHYGWRQGHWGTHQHSYGFPGSWDAPCDKAQPGAPKQPT
jgi:hypothetical protein